MKISHLVCLAGAVILVMVLGMACPSGEKDLPALPEGSAYLEQIEPEQYPPAAAPAEAPLLRWDFAADRVYPYDFAQQVVMQSRLGGMFAREEGGGSTQKMTGRGNLSLKSEGDHTARLVLEDLTMRVEMDLPNQKDPEVMENAAPPMVIQGIGEDGDMAVGNSSQRLLIKMLFLLPPEPLQPGESVSVPGRMPFNVMGSVLHVTGSSDITLGGYVDLDGRTCARLITNIDISQLDVPEEMEGTYACRVRGESVFYFDVEDRHFVAGRLALLMSIRADAPLPGEADADEAPRRMTMAMDSDNLLTVDYAGDA
ncbi:MAG: hypothetical protein ACLFPD_08800 [Desulfosudaceae bacterium]